MNALAVAQRALLDALFTPAHTVETKFATNNIAAHAYYTGARGLKAYQNNAFSLARNTLQAAYPVMAQMLGNEAFALLARDFWHAHPPVLLVLGLGGRFAALGLSVVNVVAVISLSEIAPAAFQQHITWGVLLAGLAIYGCGKWSLDRWTGAWLRR